MSVIIGKGLGEELLAQLKSAQGQAKDSLVQSSPQGLNKGPTFLEHLQSGVKEVDQMEKASDKMSVDVSTGKSGDLHEAMLAATQAELSFNLMVQVRNRALEAYQEVMRMPV